MLVASKSRVLMVEIIMFVCVVLGELHATRSGGAAPASKVTWRFLNPSSLSFYLHEYLYPALFFIIRPESHCDIQNGHIHEHRSKFVKIDHKRKLSMNQLLK